MRDNETLSHAGPGSRLGTFHQFSFINLLPSSQAKCGLLQLYLTSYPSKEDGFVKEV